MQRRPAVLTVFLWGALVSPSVLADCNDKLAELDRRIAGPEMIETQRNAVQMFRDQAATMCHSGNEASAMQMLVMMEAMLPPAQADVDAARQSDEETKAPLTREFLQGTWCSMTGEERSQLVFAPDGTSEACLPEANGQRCVGYKPVAEWLAGFRRAESIEKDRIVLVGRRGQMVFNRGECGLYGR